MNGDPGHHVQIVHPDLTPRDEGERNATRQPYSMPCHNQA